MPPHSVDGDHCNESQHLLPNAVPQRDGNDSDTADSHTSFASSSLSIMELNNFHPLERPPDNDKDLDGLVEPRDAEQPVAPDQFIDGYETTKWELWAYYIYYIGNTGLGLYQFAPTAFQNLLSQAAGDTGLLHFAGRNRNVNSIVLLSNGISFSVQVVLFLVLGSYADFGTWRPWILIVQTAFAIAIGFGWLGVHTPDKWEYGAGLYIVGLILFQLAYAYWFAAFPGLARNTSTLREHATKYNAHEISREEYDAVDSMKRNEICNTGLYISGMGEIPLVAIGIGILYGVHSNQSTANNNWGLSVLIAWSSTFWLVLAIPWFVLEKRRPGQPLPPGKTIVTAGLWQIYRAAVHIWRLKQSLAYLIGTFTPENFRDVVAQTIGIYVFMHAQCRWSLSTKTMLNAVAVSIIALDVYGMLGVWTQAISEVTPRGKEFLFFSLFNIVGKASSFVGPIISSAIIDAVHSHNNSAPFYFLTALSAVSFGVILFFVDLKRSREEQEHFLNDERRARLSLENKMMRESDP
ncbi:MAG: hypothetical protein ALECFALPRED_000512 [Alectoria fallacina]|uniref:Autophagy-related protein n=1 Tax=Alectoria fallacina TaxID=1903189 RepID=A0A8H3F6K0_9LECA|nr:MAG: hypothetical protein ALECFALPRED_000512 [Alectoria fallacina]